ncbi:FliO/MopB family protein [Candidatus Magnetomonas plexicatena]|uniref:FliO/MopB family protein n=1 Tax=Candidatus Magnetomonas plexicatena TaxID=2552947 RepID=UPI001C768F92|nr:FliO/MopB family protein [Nitrospirales bacterium LBB_01]
MTAAVIQMVFALMAVIAIIYGMSYFMKKRGKQGGFLTMKEYLPLGPKRGIAMVKAGADFLVLSVTQNDIRLLKTIKESSLDGQDFKVNLDTEVKSLQVHDTASAGTGR